MGERMALNAPIQGTAADIIKMAMLAVDRTLAKWTRPVLLLQIHDELVVEAPPEELDDVTRSSVAEMEGVVELAVPLAVDVATGPTWPTASPERRAGWRFAMAGVLPCSPASRPLRAVRSSLGGITTPYDRRTRARVVRRHRRPETVDDALDAETAAETPEASEAPEPRRKLTESAESRSSPGSV